MGIIRNIIYSFGLQLIFVHFKRHHLFLLIWLFLFLSIASGFGKPFGISYLFLDPEYLGAVGYKGFLIVGLATGILIMTFQISSYMLNSFRFPFLATLHNPFWSYFLNNGIIPLAYLITYSIMVWRFQTISGLATNTETAINLLAYLGGNALMIFVFMTYFISRNKNIGDIIQRKKKKGESIIESPKTGSSSSWVAVQKASRIWPVKNYITKRFSIRAVRGVLHYDERLLLAVFRQHHFNAFIFQFFIILLLISLGSVIEIDLFIIPAAASGLLMLSTLIMFIGAFSYWTRGWRTVSFILLILLLSILVQTDIFVYHNKAYGLKYSGLLPVYNPETIQAHGNRANIEKDTRNMTLILENWKTKNQGDSGESKPKMIFITSSGGGHRASLWSLSVLQNLDSIIGRELNDRTILYTGASGGLFGSAYYRELCYRRKMGEGINIQNPKYSSHISNDLLNPIILSVVVNDFFYPWRTVEIDGIRYNKDRAYIFERHFNMQTRYLLNKRLRDYRESEFNMEMPMMVLSPTIIDDERKLFISPHPMRFLIRPGNDTLNYYKDGIDGIDFGTFFEAQNAYDLKLTTALRMNATYPYILPNVYLPSEPFIQVMDAGIRDNYGIETVTRFISVFSDWINQNTSGVIIVSINSVNIEMLKNKPVNDNLIKRMFNPIGNLYYNWTMIQQFNQNYLIEGIKHQINGNLDFIEFNYTPGSKNERAASMSFHLTKKEKQNIINAFGLKHNRDALERLKMSFR